MMSSFIPCFRLLFVSICCTLSLYAQIPAAPTHYSGMNDFGDLLTPEEESLVSQKLKAYFDSTSTQLVVITVNSLQGLSVEDFAAQTFKAWGIGQKDKNNGLLLLIAKADHKMRLELGYGLEQYLPDVYCADLIDQVLKPRFKAGKFYDGIDEATRLMMARLRGEAAEFEGLGQAASKQTAASNMRLFWLIILLNLVGIGVFIFIFGLDVKGKKDYVTAFFVTLIVSWAMMAIATTLLFVLIACIVDIPHYLLWWVIMFTPLVWGCIPFLKKDIIQWMSGPKISKSANSKKKSYTSNSATTTTTTYSDSSSSYSDYRDYSDYSDYSDSYSDSFGGGSSGGGGASGSW